MRFHDTFGYIASLVSFPDCISRSVKSSLGTRLVLHHTDGGRVGGSLASQTHFHEVGQARGTMPLLTRVTHKNYVFGTSISVEAAE